MCGEHGRLYCSVVLSATARFRVSVVGTNMASESRAPLGGLLTAQFFGAFNDNALKYVILTLAMRPVLARNATPEDFNTASQSQATLALLTFTLPMLLFSLPGGALADRLSKSWIIVAMKTVEILLMIGETPSSHGSRCRGRDVACHASGRRVTVVS